MKIYADQLWFLFGLFFLILGIVTTLGEYVFHWWDQPWDVGGPLSLALAVFGFFWSASSREMRAGFRDLREGQREQTDHMREQNDLLWEMRQAQQGQATSAGQDQLLAQGREQTSLLRELLDAFRRPR